MGCLEQLMQFIKGPVWDGNLISKTDRDHLENHYLVQRVHGWNFLTGKGVEYLVVLKILKP